VAYQAADIREISMFKELKSPCSDYATGWTTSELEFVSWLDRHFSLHYYIHPEDHPASYPICTSIMGFLHGGKAAEV
jgi:hypothetical protein